MNQQATRLARNASTAVIWPIVGLLGGLFIGGLRARSRGSDPFAQIACVIRWGVTGFFAGLALVVLLVFVAQRQNQVTIRKLMVLVVMIGMLAWFFGRVFFEAIGFEGF
jgi:hypothetical protein